MKLIIEPTEKLMSEAAMHIILGAMYQDKRVNISLTSGRSPRTLYEMMVPLVKDQKKFADIQYYLFDDSPYVGQEHGGNWAEMQELFFQPANISNERIHITTMENWETYDEEIRNSGGIDVMIIGLGWDGHFCGNMPHTTPLDSYTYKTDFEEVRAKNPSYEPRPEKPVLLTMGPKSLMRVKHLVMIVNGQEKAEILKRFLDEPISPENPSTVLKLHPNFTVICDQDAASCIDPSEYEKL